MKTLSAPVSKRSSTNNVVLVFTGVPLSFKTNPPGMAKFCTQSPPPTTMVFASRSPSISKPSEGVITSTTVACACTLPQYDKRIILNKKRNLFNGM